jgi:HEXXH motif-containing protein
MTLDRPSWRWSRAGNAVAMPNGRHDLAALDAGGVVSDQTIALDPYCAATGVPLERSWRAPLTPADASRLHATLREIRHALDACARLLPECVAWAGAVVRVIVPLRSDGAGAWSSGSRPEIPGLIQLTGLVGPTMALEGLVHEAAHHHFTLLEAAGPLVDPGHDALYPSPLRSDPRPLRSVLLASHALAHIVAFYDEGLATGLLSAGWADRRAGLVRRLDAGLASAERGRPHCTESGAQLVARMTAVSSSGRAPAARSG